MKQTRMGIWYIESTDVRWKFPEQSKMIAESIEVLIQELRDRVEALERSVQVGLDCTDHDAKWTDS